MSSSSLLCLGQYQKRPACGCLYKSSSSVSCELPELLLAEYGSALKMHVGENLEKMVDSFIEEVANYDPSGT